MKDNNLINLFLLKKLETKGKEIKFVKRGSRIISGSVVEPLRKLLQKGIINQSSYNAGVKYCNDYELSNMSHHARPSYDGSSINSSTPRERMIFQHQLNATKNVDAIKILIKEKDQVNPTSILTKKYTIILDLIFERQLSIYAVNKRTKICYELLEKKIIEILKILTKYYN